VSYRSLELPDDEQLTENVLHRECAQLFAIYLKIPVFEWSHDANTQLSLVRLTELASTASVHVSE